MARQLLCAVSEPFRYAETVATLQCAGYTFIAKGKMVISPGWKDYLPQEQQEKPLPELAENQSIPITDATVKEGKTTPPKHFTEDTLLSAMETAGAKDKVNCPNGAREGGLGQMPDDAERKGLGTPATRAATLEKLISTGFLERRKVKKTVNLIPAHAGISLITVLPEQLQSPLLTAEWENQLKQVERGELDAAAFMSGIGKMLPSAIMAVLIVYCLKDIGDDWIGIGIPRMLAVAIVVFSYKWKHSTLLSIVSGTAAYMLFLPLF